MSHVRESPSFFEDLGEVIAGVNKLREGGEQFAGAAVRTARRVDGVVTHLGQAQTLDRIAARALGAGLDALGEEVARAPEPRAKLQPIVVLSEGEFSIRAFQDGAVFALRGSTVIARGTWTAERVELQVLDLATKPPRTLVQGLAAKLRERRSV